jgi:hypothetical protein
VQIRPRASLAFVAALVTSVLLPVASGGAASTDCPSPPPLRFGHQTYVDTGRAGGEPIVALHPNGELLYAAHAGTTHFYTPAAGDEDTTAFSDKYEGRTYIWRSRDNGGTWTFVPRPTPDNVPLQGFSDPDFAIDSAGNVFFSEINLVNVAMSRSGDEGKSYKLANFFAQVLTDRQWSEADTEDLVYLVGNAAGGGTSTKPVGNDGHYLYRSTDGGKTFTTGLHDNEAGDGLGDLRVDKRNGTLYEAHYDKGVLSMAAFRQARAGDLSVEVNPIARDVGMLGHWPAFDVDDAGDLYIAWDERATSKRRNGIFFSYSKDEGRTWSDPVRVDSGTQTVMWPWLAVGDPGRVGIGWLEASRAVPRHDPQTKGTHTWRVMAAQTLSGLGCESSPVPTFSVAAATKQPIHSGTICTGGTVCQAQAIDRRLGDYMSVEIDATGAMVAAYSDTRRGGAVSLPGFVRQTGGASFLAAGDATEVLGSRTQRRALPSTGAGGYATLGALLIAGAGVLRRSLARAR